MTESTSKTIGKRGEEAACRYLERRGYTIIERNWACELGEIDIIAKDNEREQIAMVEVNTRTGREMPNDVITASKRTRYENLAIAYLSENAQKVPTDVAMRFDTIGIVVVAPERAMVRHHINAWGIE